MSFYRALEDSNATLTAAERRVAGLLLADPRGAPFLRAADLARKAEVHESTVVRFAQKLGYSGLIDMRQALIADSISSMDRTIAMREEGEPFSLALVISSQVQALEELAEKVPQERIDSVVAAVLGGRHVHVMGHGLLLPAVELLRAKFAKSGLHVRDITQTGHERAQRLALVGPGDVLVCLAFADDYQKIRQQLELLERDGTTVVLLTDEEALLSPQLPAHVIAIPRDRARHGVLVPMTALCYAIHYDLLQHRAEEMRAVRARAAQLEAAEAPPDEARADAAEHA